jgi:hypothetical protein
MVSQNVTEPSPKPLVRSTITTVLQSSHVVGHDMVAEVLAPDFDWSN